MLEQFVSGYIRLGQVRPGFAILAEVR